MKKRLRKKKRVGEFQEDGFFVGFAVSSVLSTLARDAIFDDWIENAIEAHGLQFGGGCNGIACSGYVEKDGRGSVSEGQRSAVRSWLSAEPHIVEFTLGPAVDMWHGNYGDNWKSKRPTLSVDHPSA